MTDESGVITDGPADETTPVDEPPKLNVIVTVGLGSEAIEVGLVTVQGELLDRDRVEVDPRLTAEALLDSVTEAIHPLLDRAKERHHARGIAVGVASAGPVGTDGGVVAPLGIAVWRDFPLRQRLRAALGLPTFIEMDAKALAMAEGWLGAAVGKDSFLAMVVGTGVGGGIVLNGQLMDGASGNAGHIGHIVVEPNGRRCPCGSRGCLEAEASGPAIEQITGRSPTEPSYEIMQRTGKLVGTAVASVCNLLDLDLVVCGGAVALGFGATFFNSAQDALTEHARLGFSKSARIVPARLGEKGPLVGAAAVAIKGLNRARRGKPRPGREAALG